MNKKRLEGKWRQARGAVKKRLGNLTADKREQTEGDADRLIGKVQGKYGTAREEVAAILSGVKKEMAKPRRAKSAQEIGRY